MTPHLLCYQGLVLDDYSCGLDACPVKCEAYFTGAVSTPEAGKPRLLQC